MFITWNQSQENSIWEFILLLSCGWFSVYFPPFERPAVWYQTVSCGIKLWVVYEISEYRPLSGTASVLCWLHVESMEPELLRNAGGKHRPSLLGPIKIFLHEDLLESKISCVLLKEREGITREWVLCKSRSNICKRGMYKTILKRVKSLSHGYGYLPGGSLTTHKNWESKGNSEFV